VSYEGQAAAELEGAADPCERGAYSLRVTEEMVLDPRETVLACRCDLERGQPVALVAARFHNAVAAATAEACAAVAQARGLGSVVMSGGVFQNRLLLERTQELLRARGLRLLVPERFPPNDGGVSYGQAAVAAARLR
jgi:hydrogenase maturation protein HypF